MTHLTHKRRPAANPVERQSDGTSGLEPWRGDTAVFCNIDTVDYDTVKIEGSYLRCHARAATRDGSPVRMSTLLLPGGAKYKNRDYLDHRRCNLRPATRQQMVARTRI